MNSPLNDQRLIDSMGQWGTSGPAPIQETEKALESFGRWGSGAQVQRIDTKRDELVASLREAAQRRQEAVEQRSRSLSATAEKWLGVQEGGVISRGANLFASGVNMFEKLATGTVTAPIDAVALNRMAIVPQEARDAYARRRAGTATEEDIALLQQVTRTDGGAVQYEEGVVGQTTPQAATEFATEQDDMNVFTNEQRINQSRALTATSELIERRLDTDHLVDSQYMEGTVEELRERSAPGLANLQETWSRIEDEGLKDNLLDLSMEVADLVGEGIATLANNPQGTAELSAQMVAQVAAAMKGKSLLGVAHTGLALEMLRDEIIAYDQENQGVMSKEDLEDRTLAALSHAAISFMGDAGVAKGVGTMLGKRQAGETLGRTVARNAGIAGASTLGESVAEGVQGGLEANIRGEDMTAEAVYENFVLGMGGAGPLSAVSAVGAVRQERDQNARETIQADFKQATEANDPSSYMNRGSETYSPRMAMGVLFANANKPDATPERKAENRTRAEEVVAAAQQDVDTRKAELDLVNPELQERRLEMVTELETALESASPEEKGSIELKLEILKKTIEDTEKLGKAEYRKRERALKTAQDELDTVLGMRTNMVKDTPYTPEEVSSLLEQAKVTTSPEQQAAATATVINLAMESPDLFTPDQIDDLVTSNPSLPTVQQEMLRTFSARVRAMNAAKTMGDVTKGVLEGTDGFKGLPEYRDNIARASRFGRTQVVKKEMEKLSEFLGSHTQKAALATEANTLAAKNGTPVQLVRTTEGQWQLTQGVENYREGGGLQFDGDTKGAKLAQAIEAERVAISAAMQEANALVALGTPASTAELTATTAPTPQATTAPVVEETPVPAVETVADVPTEATPVPAVEPAPNTPTPEASDAQVTTELPTSDVEVNGTTEVEPTESTTSNTETTEAEVTTGELNNVRERNIAVMQEDGTTVSQPKKNPISRYFKQTGAKGEGAARKPLVAKKDFLSAIRQDAKVLMDFLKEAPTDQQKVTLNSLVRHARKWAPALGKSVPQPGNPDYMYKDVLQGLANEDGTYDENVITAMAVSAFRWIAEASTMAQENNDEAINALLGRGRSTNVDWEEKEIFGSIGTRRARLINSLGRTAVQMLGLTALDENTPNDQVSRLESAVGAHIYGLLKKEGLLVERTLSSDTMKMYMNKDQEGDVEASVQDKNANAEHVFVRMRGTLNGEEVSPLVQQIHDAVRNSEGILEKLFGIDSEGTQPSFEPVPFKQELAQKSTTNVPSVQAEGLDKHNKKPNVIRTDGMSKAMERLPEAALLAMAGYVDKTQTYIHPNNEASVDAKNNGLKRELKQYYDFVELAKSKELGIKQPFFLQHVVWVQQRVGMLSRGINMQASKIHRYLVQMTGWEQKDVAIDPADPAFIQFQLAVADSIGVGTDKLESAEKAIAEMESKLGSELMKEALTTLRKILNDMPLQDREIERLVDAIQQEGGENFHSLDGLMGYATYLDAVEHGNTTFTHSLTREIDGKTNGPMLTQLLTGAASSVRAMQAMVEKGGFFSSASAFTQVNKWAATSGNNDLYQSVAKAINENVVGLVENNPIKYNALFALSSPLVDGAGYVTPEGRNATKTPVTQVNFGSSINNTVKSMGAEFADNILKRVEKVVNKHQEKGTDPTAELQEISDHIKTLTGLNLPPKKLVGKLHNNVGKALQSQYVLLMKEPIKAGIESHYKEFLRTRDQINGAGKLAFNLYDTVRKIERAKLVATITERDKNGNPKHDLSRAQEKELAARLAHMEPIVHTAMSKLSNDIKAGFSLIKRKQALSNQREYLTEAKFGEGGWEFQDARTGAVRNMSSTKVSGMATEQMDRGVGALVLLVHSFDSAISTLSYADQAALNVHDANIVAAIDTLAQAKRLNENTFKLLMGYSIPTEMANTLANTLEGFALEIERDPHNPELKKAYKAMTKDARALMEDGDYIIARSLKLDPVGYQLYNMLAVAKKADITKLKAMRDWTAVDQYSMDGGNYIPSPEDKAEIERLLAEREMDDLESRLDTVRHLAALMNSKPTQAKASDKADATSFGEVGKARGAVDPELNAFLAQRKILPAKLLMTYLKKSINNMTPFQDTLLKELNKRVDNVTVVYVTPGMAVPEGTKERAAGWFYQDKNGKKTIYVRSPDFTASRIDPELMLHELVHAATANTMAEARNNPDAYPEVIEILEDLEQLRVTVEKHLIGDVERLRQYSPALVNVEELVAWGMTNEGFQQVLKEVQVEAREKNTLVEGMKSFIKSLVRLVFPSGASQQEVMESGLTRLISDAAAIMGADTRPGQEINLAQEIVDPLDEVMQWETLQVFDALVRPTDSTSPEHQANLRILMDSVVTRLHGPFGAFKVEATKRQALTPDEVFIKAIQDNQAPFASDTLAAGFKLSHQEAFVLESVEATIAATLDSSSLSYKELAKVYQQARKSLRNNPALTDDQYAFLFAMTNGADGKSAHLSRFAALALAYEPLNQAMKQMVPEEVGTPENASLASRIQSWFNQVLAFINERLTGIHSSQTAPDKINTLLNNLVHIEAKQRVRLANQRSNPFDFIEKGLEEAADKGREGLDKIGNSKVFKESSNGYVRAFGKGLSTVARERAGDVINIMQIMRDRHYKRRQGMVSAIISEMTGPDDKTKTLYMLNRMTKNVERTRIEAATQVGAQILKAYDGQGKELTKDQKDDLTRVLLHTDLSSLVDVYDMDMIHDLLLDRTRLNQERVQLERKVAALPMGKLYVRQADDLGWYMAGNANRNPMLQRNAHNIAHLYGLPEAKQVEVGPDTVAMIDQLATLNALRYTKTEKVQSVIAKEKLRGNESGIEFTLRMAKYQKEESLGKLFDGSPVLMIKGYTKEITDPYITAVAASAADEAVMKKRGYSASPELIQDLADTTGAKKLYVINDGGLKQYLSGTMSLTGEQAKGTALHDGLSPQGNSQLIQSRMAMTDAMTRKKQSLYRESKAQGNHMVPIFNESGNLVNYAYTMTAKTRDNVLGRNNALDAVMGGLEGELIDKVASPEHNRQVVSALYDLYKQDYYARPDSYLTISAKSDDPRLREIHRMLPYKTKQAMQEIWGRDELVVRADVLDLVFGYRKYSVADAISKAQTRRSTGERGQDGFIKETIEDSILVVAEALFKDQAGIKIRKYEEITQTIVKHVKDILVVKNLFTLLGNVASNTSQLVWHGVNPQALVKHHKEATESAIAYRRDKRELDELEKRQAMGYTTLGEINIAQRIPELRDSLARNPSTPLIESGMMPTIVEDIDLVQDPYSYQSKTAKRLEGWIEKVPSSVRAVGKQAYMTHDTTMYKVLSQGTQLSDYVARYTLYQHVRNRDKASMSHDEAMFFVMEAFVNYDIPTNRTLQYMNDMGFVFFTKYYLRIQRVILALYRDQPARALAMVAFNGFFEGAQTVMDSQATGQLGNPLASSVLRFPDTVDELATWQLATEIMK